MGLFDVVVFGRERRSLENPSTPLSDPDDWLFDAFGAQQSSSGVRISAESALAYAPWWRGINLVSRSVAKLPLVTYKRNGAGKSADINHATFGLLYDQSNEELMTAFTMKQTIQAHAMSYGNGYAWIKRDRNATPLELIILNPFDCYPFRENGRLWYAVRVDTEWRRVNPTDILHIKGLSADGLVGYSVYSKARESVGEGKAAQQYGSVFFRNNARPSVVIEVPQTMSEEGQKTFLKQWERMHTGLESSHRTAILTSGAKVNAFSANAEESQLQELRKFNLVDIANFVGVPVHKLGGEGVSAYASLEQENQAYLDDSLDPWLCNWESECRIKLLTEKEKRDRTHLIEFTRNALVRADIVARYTAYNIGIRGGWLNPDMVLSKENENPIPDGLGQNFFRPLELAVVGQDEPPEVDDLGPVLAVTSEVVAGTLPPESAKAMLKAAYPQLDDAQINAIIDPLEVIEPPPPVVPATDAVPQPSPGPATTPEMHNSNAAATARRVLIDASRRACRHLRIQAVRRAKLSGNFLEMIDEDRSEDEGKVSDIIGDSVTLCMAATGQDVNADASGFIWTETKTAILAASSVSHDALAGSVDAYLTELEATLPERVADLLLKGPENGTPIPEE